LVLGPVPIGSLVFALCVAVAVAPVRRPRPLGVLSWIGSMAPNELPGLFAAIVVATTLPEVLDADDPTAERWASGVIALVTITGLLIVLWRARHTVATLDAAMDDALGTGWRTSPERRRRPWRQALLPFPVRPREVERIRDVAYADGGRANLLDVYRHRSHPTNAPTLIHLHGGHFRSGAKSRESRALLHHLAGRGWTCISANYHRSRTPAAGFPEHLVDVKRVLAWVQRHGAEHGADPQRVVVAGSSAGAHLATMAAFTANDPRFQPGFEDVDTTVTAAIGLYGYYGSLGDTATSSSPADHVGPGAPPVLVVHGRNDTYVPVEGAREFVGRMRRGSSAAVVYAELTGAQHSFDLFHSVRFDAVIDTIEAFASWATNARRPITH
jgi:acetyl esterase/lipase